MVAHVNQFAADMLIARPGMGADGVVRVQVGSALGSGVLLYDGRHVLTARHLFEGASGPLSMSVGFETRSGTTSVAVEEALGLKSWDVKNVSSDLVLLRLKEAAPLDAERYTIYRDSDEIGRSFVMVGYGQSALGDAEMSNEDAGIGMALRRYAANRFDGEMSMLKSVAGSSLSWTPPRDTQLWADFDSGLRAHDATRFWTSRPDVGRADLEGMISRGDSGSPAFINGQIAGLSSYTFRSSPTDIDLVSNSSFGEIGVWQRVSSFQQWIDQTIRASYVDAPRKASEVKTLVNEGDRGTVLTFFLLELNGARQDPSEILSFQYATRNGTARAGEDYVATSGVLNLYPGEEKAVIAVEVIGDLQVEADETFYLDLWSVDQSGTADGGVQVTAMRTIVNDDDFLLGFG